MQPFDFEWDTRRWGDAILASEFTFPENLICTAGLAFAQVAQFLLAEK